MNDTVSTILIIIILLLFLLIRYRKGKIINYNDSDYNNMLSVRTLLITILGIVLLVLMLFKE